MASTARLPKVFYRVVITSGAAKLRMYDKKSATYASRKFAQEHLDFLRRRGVECDLYETTTDWQLVDAQPELDNQDPLF